MTRIEDAYDPDHHRRIPFVTHLRHPDTEALRAELDKEKREASDREERAEGPAS